MPQTKEDMSPTYAYLRKNTKINKNGAIHLGMLPFITRFELVKEKMIEKKLRSHVVMAKLVKYIKDY